MIGVVWAVAWRIVATLWSLAGLTLVALVVGAVRRERRERRADVRRVRATGLAMGWPTPNSDDDDWRAIEAAVRSVHEACDDTIAEHFAAWDKQLADGAA